MTAKLGNKTAVAAPAQKQLCRLCYYETNDTIEIFSEKGIAFDYIRKINKYLYLKVYEEDEQPKTVCWMCSQHLETFDRFYGKINEVQQSMLMDHYKNVKIYPVHEKQFHTIESQTDDVYIYDEMIYTTDGVDKINDKFVILEMHAEKVIDSHINEQTEEVENDSKQTETEAEEHLSETQSYVEIIEQCEEQPLDESSLVDLFDDVVVNEPVLPDTVPIKQEEEICIGDLDTTEVKRPYKLRTYANKQSTRTKRLLTQAKIKNIEPVAVSQPDKRKRGRPKVVKNTTNETKSPVPTEIMKIPESTEMMKSPESTEMMKIPESIEMTEPIEAPAVASIKPESAKATTSKTPTKSQPRKQKTPKVRPKSHVDIPMHDIEEGESGDEFPARDSDNEDWPAQQTLNHFPEKIIQNGLLLVKGKLLMTMICKFYKLKCEVCPTDDQPRFKQLRDLFTHYNDVHNEEGYVTCCQTKLNRYPAIIMHMARHLQPEAFKCPQCGYMVTRPRFLESHIQTHLPEDQKPFACFECPRRFCWKGALQIHMISHQPRDERKLYICHVCGKSYDTPGGLSTHKKLIHGDKNLGTNICHVCAKKFATRTGLNEHMATIHQPREKDQQQCPECGKWLMNTRCLKSHMVLHSNTLLHCDNCDYSTKKPILLRRHLLTQHSDVKPFSCELCNKSFKLKRALTVHLAQHNSTKSYKCTFCDRVFRNSTNFYTHRKNMHPNELQQMKDRELETQRQKRINAGIEDGKIIEIYEPQQYDEEDGGSNDMEEMEIMTVYEGIQDGQQDQIHTQQVTIIPVKDDQQHILISTGDGSGIRILDTSQVTTDGGTIRFDSNTLATLIEYHSSGQDAATSDQSIILTNDR